jgi:thiamine-monophosphate kinase
LAAELGATAMIDVSDGLLQDVGHLASASQVAIDLRSNQFEVGEPLQAVGAALSVDPLKFVLTGGDDYSLVATFPAGTKLAEQWREIGRVLDSGDQGAVTVDGAEYQDGGGHQHFR